MSNALALAHVTQALALLIEDNLQPEIDIAVNVEPRKPPADPPTDPTITVFLYQVTPNTSQRNNDLPTRASDGTLLKRPAAALDLHFVISAYGDETTLVGQRLIGSVVRTLHEIPILPKDMIELAGEKPYLAGSDLADAVQKVRFTPTVMDIDETSKLWGMLHQTPYSLSVVYQAALVFIEGREVPVPAKPVERHTVKVLPFGAPGAPERPVVGADADAGAGAGAGVGSGSGSAFDGGTSTGSGRASGAGPASAEVALPAQAGTSANATTKAVAKAPAKAPAKTTAKAPARARKTAAARGAAAKNNAEPDAPKAEGAGAEGAES
ncbi:DUF4255 domain-containing protein [Streptomyces sp. NBC_01304]|uniref:DUF4255 domain-containing protein n=1 Tax=Streptomyces sp. NBC_01304 TaxID=2903818 RepID=UPI002E0F1A46|nr:DUF4255 domain-containing protein [Streptomyces sp. NBC_01304]